VNARAGGRLFRSYVAVDWSASARPKTGTDSIWVGWVPAESSTAGPAQAVNVATRTAAVDRLAELVGGLRGPVLLAIDAGLGYPTGTAAAAGLAGAGALGGLDPESVRGRAGAVRRRPWEAMWQFLASAVRDDHRNRNNRFEVAAALNRRIGPGAGPFWGTPARTASDALSPTKAPGFPHRTASGAELAELRRCEALARSCGHRVSSPWQLLGTGSVGGQSLTAIPALARLGERLRSSGRHMVLWPFETGLDIPSPLAGVEAGRTADAYVVVAETWPGLFPMHECAHEVRDARQVLNVAHHLCRLDGEGHLGAWLAPAVDDLTRAAAVDEEGWILGLR
jgi:hypothetical protein